MFKITLPGGAFHLVPAASDDTPAIEAYSTSLNTRAALQEAYDRGDIEPYTPPEPEQLPPQPDWDGFNAAAMTDPRLNAVMGAVLTQAPAIALGLPAALAQVASNGVTAFAPVFEALCQLGGATEGDRAAWAELAEANHLPAEFTAIVRGNDG